MCQCCLKMSEHKLWYIAALLQKEHLERPHVEAPKGLPRSPGAVRGPHRHEGGDAQFIVIPSSDS